MDRRSAALRGPPAAASSTSPRSCSPPTDGSTPAWPARGPWPPSSRASTPSWSPPSTPTSSSTTGPAGRCRSWRTASTRTSTGPQIELRAGRDDDGHDVLVLVGPEPDSRWQAFAGAVAELAGMFGVRLLVGMAGFPAPVPHTRTAPLAASASSTELATVDRRGARHPAGAGGHPGRPRASGWASMGVPTIGLWARVPHYAAGHALPRRQHPAPRGPRPGDGRPGRRPRAAGGGRRDPPPPRRAGVQQRPAPHPRPPARGPVRRRGREPERGGRRAGPTSPPATSWPPSWRSSSATSPRNPA